MHSYRTHTCGELRKDNVDEVVRLSGWIHRVRDHGGVLFIDLRDMYGLTQCVVDEGSPLIETVSEWRNESVITVTGKVKARTPETVNPKMKTGDVEVYIDEAALCSSAAVIPFQVAEDDGAGEDVRLKYRYLDLRREKMQKNIRLRGDVIHSIRSKMREQGFQEFQTPVLTASSPEGARDFLVPSRLHPGKFYALPQAPQQFKQLLMCSGFDRYFQIAPCFRDEDSRADRLAEHYQLDVEMAFVTQDDVFAAMEPVIHGVFSEFGGGKAVTETPFPRIPYHEAMRKYGSDKPDLRNPVVMQDVTDHFRDSGFKIFTNMIAGDPKVRVWAIPAPGGGSRAFCDRMNSWAQDQGQPGLGYIFFGDGEGKGPIAKNVGEDRTKAILQQLELKDGDAAFFVAGVPAKFHKFAGDARNRVGSELDLFEKDVFKFCWIVDFPMYEIDEESGALDFSHNPFSMPQGGMGALETDKPEEVRAWQYDCVCNGTELSSGAIRNHEPATMEKAFGLVGYDVSVIKERFSALYTAFQYGAPPHGGCAFGIDRIVMLLAGEPNIREVNAFCMNGQYEDPMMNAPSVVDEEQLKDLHLKLNLPKNVKKQDPEAA